MSSLAFWKAVVADKSNFLERVIALLESSGFPYCVIGGVAVNAYAEVAITKYFDVSVRSNDFAAVVEKLHAQFEISTDETETTIFRTAGSGLEVRVFVAKPGWGARPKSCQRMDVCGLQLPVASSDATARFWAERASDIRLRKSHRAIEIYHLARLVEASPELLPLIPDTVRESMVA